MASAIGGPPDHLVWERTTVGGRPALYGVAGEGRPVVFLHGWALGQHSYKRALKRLVRLGCRVHAPALPGFGGTPMLPSDSRSFEGYAAWLDEFFEAAGIESPAFVIGHSFGGGVSIQLAHDFPQRVRSLVLVNSVGGASWTDVAHGARRLAERPLWDWGLRFPGDVLPTLTRVLPPVLEDLMPNLVRNPLALVRVANLVRSADMSTQLEELNARGTPITAIWGSADRIIPRASFDALCAAIGSDGEVVRGSHTWLLADPDAFSEVMTNVLAVADLARRADATGSRSSTAADGAAHDAVDADDAAADADDVVVPPPAPVLTWPAPVTTLVRLIRRVI